MNPLGGSRAQFWDALRSGNSALRVESAGATAEGGKLAALLGKGDASQAGPLSYAAARVGDFGAAQAIDANRRRRMPRLGQMAIVAAQQALVGVDGGRSDASSAASPAAFYGAERVGVALGTALGALDLTVEFMTQYLAAGLSSASPASFPYTVLNTPAALIAMELGLRGPNVTVNHRDLSASEALVTACEILLCGRADAVLAGGADELSASLLHAYRRFSGLADAGPVRPGDASGADVPPGPYDRRRRGLCPGEGATLFLLERADAAERRGVTPLAKIAGYGRAGDTRARIGWTEQPAIAAQGSSGAVSALQAAAQMAGCGLEQIDCIAGSGNGTRLDLIETGVLRAALGQSADRVSVLSLLGQTGEWPTSAAARVAQALFALKQQALPRFECPQPDAQAALPGLCTRAGTAGSDREPIASSVQHVLVPCLAQGGGSVAIMLARA